MSVKSRALEVEVPVRWTRRERRGKHDLLADGSGWLRYCRDQLLLLLLGCYNASLDTISCSTADEIELEESGWGAFMLGTVEVDAEVDLGMGEVTGKVAIVDHGPDFRATFGGGLGDCLMLVVWFA